MSEDEFWWRLAGWWGALFRAFFIGTVGFVGWALIDPQSIFDVPFAELTLGHLAKNAFAFALGLGCFSWFFSFPERFNSLDLPENGPYIFWAKFGGWAIAAIIVGYQFIN